jgi:RecA-family ATPase
MGSEGAELFKLITPEELDKLPELSWLIEGVLPAKAFAILFGQPSSFKTFVALSMALSIASRHNWYNKTIKHGPVLYVAAEGLHGLQLRVRAYRLKHGITEEHILYFGEGVNLREIDTIEKLIASLEAAECRPVLIVFDTLARSILGADENSAQDMSKIIGAIDRLRRATEATVLVVHHTGKGGESERGSSALRGAADVMIKCSVDLGGESVLLKCDKMKEAEQFASVKIILHRVQS